MTDSEREISHVCDSIKTMLLSKNMHYGDSALNPIRCFSNATPIEQLLVRIDDKINRIRQGSGYFGDDEDVINDLVGYLILLRIALDRDYAASYNTNDSES